MARSLAAFLCFVLSAAGCVTDRTLVKPPMHRASTPNDPPLASSERPTSSPDRSIQKVAYHSVLDQSPDLTDRASAPCEVFYEEAAGAQPISLAELESLAMQHNPALQQAYAQTSQLQGTREQVGLKPNPSIGYFGEEIGNENAGGLHGAFLSQAFVRGNKLGWNRAILGRQVQQAQWLAESQRYRIRSDLRMFFYDALGAQKRLTLARKFREQADEGLQISKARVAAQEAARPDVLQSEVQLSEVDLAIQRATFEFEAAWQQLAATVGIPELTSHTLAGDFDAPDGFREFESEYALALATSPVLAAAEAAVQAAHANLHRQRVQAIPNVNTQFGTGYDDSTGDEFANVQISMPLPVHNQNQGNIRAAQAAHCAAIQNVQRLRMQLRRDLATAFQQYKMAQAMVKQYEALILPKVRMTLELMQEAQRAGEFDFLRVLTARRMYFDANLQYVAALTDLSKANASLDGILLAGGLQSQPALTNTGLRGAALSGQ